MKKILTAVFAAILVVSFTGMALAERPGGSPMMDGRGMTGNGPGSDRGTEDNIDGTMNIGKAMRFAKELGLSEKQIDQLETLRLKHRREHMELRHIVAMSKLDIHEEFRKDKPDKAKINKAVDKISEAQKDMMKIGIASILESKEILTKDQFKKLQRMYHFDGNKKDRDGKKIKKDKKGWFK